MNEVRFPDAFAVVAGDTPTEELAALRRFFRHVIPLPADESIDGPVAHHPDMLFAVAGDCLVTHRAYYGGARAVVDEICALGGLRLVLSDMARGPVYPADIGFNALFWGDCFLGNTAHLAPEVCALSAEAGLTSVSVKQGYAACAVLAVPSVKLAATADGGLAAALGSRGADVVRLSAEAGILLPGYDCGFIGGATGVWGRTVFFSGNPAHHPALAALCRELTRRGVETVALSAGRLTDRGGVRVLALRG